MWPEGRRCDGPRADPGPQPITQARPLDIGREANGLLSLVIDYRVTAPAAGRVTIGMRGGKLAEVPVSGSMRQAGDWRQLAIPLRCFASAVVPIWRR